MRPHHILALTLLWPGLRPVKAGACTPPPTKSLVVKYRCQEAPNWCWAAAVEMITDHYGHRVSQCQQATDLARAQDAPDSQAPCCEEASLSTCLRDDVRGTAACHAARAPELQRYGFSCVFTRGLSWEDARHEIACEGRPFLVALQNQGPVGHMVVVIGYAHGHGNQRYLMVLDPHRVTDSAPQRIRLRDLAVSYAVTGIVQEGSRASCPIPSQPFKSARQTNDLRHAKTE